MLTDEMRRNEVYKTTPLTPIQTYNNKTIPRSLIF